MLALFAAAGTFSFAADSPKKHFDIPAATADKALRAFSSQSGLEVIFATDIASGVNANPVKGEFSPQDAVQFLLSGTGLVATQDGTTGAFMVNRANDPNVQRAVATTADRPVQGTPTNDEEKKALLLGEFVVKDRKPFLGSDVDIPRSPDDIQPYYEWNSGALEHSGATDIQDFFQKEVPMDTNHLSFAQIPNSGFATSQISLGGLSGNFGPSTGTQNTLILVNGLPLPNFSELGGTYEPNLNAIPLAAIDHIEVLTASDSAIYGPSAAAGVVNIVLKHDYNGVELSETFGSPFDAHAPTQSASLTVGESLEGGRTNLLFAANYQTVQAPVVQDRLGQIVSPYQARYFSGYPGGELAYIGITSGTGILGQPIITSANGTPLFAGSSAKTVQVPVGYQGGQGLAPLQANVGDYLLSHPNIQANSGILGLQLPMTLQPTEKSFQISVSRQMAGWLQLYGNFFNSSEPNLLGINGEVFTGVTEPAANPGNPFGQNVTVSGANAQNFPPAVSNILSLYASLGAKIDLPFGWRANLNYSWGTSDFFDRADSLDTTALKAAVTSGAVNLITDLSRYPFNGLVYPTIVNLQAKSSVDALQLKAAGPLMTLWAGAPAFALGVEHLKTGNSGSLLAESFPADPTLVSENIYATGASQSDNSVYGELTVPIASKANGIPGVRELDFQAAGRLDSLQNFTTSPFEAISERLVSGTVITSPNLLSGAPEPFTPATSGYHATTKTFGFKYKPIDDLAIRASYATAFVPPTFSQLSAPISQGTQTESTGFFPGVPTTSPWGYQSVTDPQLSATYDTPVIVGGHPNLMPETSRGINLGIIFEPTFLAGLRVSLDYAKITKYNDIIVPSVGSLIANTAQFPGRVTRGTPNAGQTVGPIILIDDTDINAVETYTSYYNLEIDYTLKTASAGTWNLTAMANSWQHYDIQSTIGGPFVEQLGNPYTTSTGVGAGLAKFKGNIGLNWTKGPFSAGWLVRYVGPYNDGALYGLGGLDAYEEGTVNGWVSGQIYHDAYLGYKFGSAPRGLAWWKRALSLSGTSVQLGVRNVFGRVPPFDGVNSAPGLWYSTYGDELLANYYVRVRKQF